MLVFNIYTVNTFQSQVKGGVKNKDCDSISPVHVTCSQEAAAILLLPSLAVCQASAEK